MLNFSQIYEGWRNKLVPPEELRETISNVAVARMEICNGCFYHSKNHKTIRPDDHCTDCGCTLSAKVRCLSCNCGLAQPKWVAVLESLEDEHSVKQEIYNGK
jgi:hypothetical protein